MFLEKKFTSQTNLLTRILGQDNPSTDCIVGHVPDVLDGNIGNHRGPYDGVTVTMGCILEISGVFKFGHHFSFLNVFLSQTGLLTIYLLTKYI